MKNFDRIKSIIAVSLCATLVATSVLAEATRGIGASEQLSNAVSPMQAVFSQEAFASRAVNVRRLIAANLTDRIRLTTSRLTGFKPSPRQSMQSFPRIVSGNPSVYRKPILRALATIGLAAFPLAAFAQGGNAVSSSWLADNYGWVILGGRVTGLFIMGLAWYFTPYQRLRRLAGISGDSYWKGDRLKTRDPDAGKRQTIDRAIAALEKVDFSAIRAKLGLPAEEAISEAEYIRPITWVRRLARALGKILHFEVGYELDRIGEARRTLRDSGVVVPEDASYRDMLGLIFEADRQRGPDGRLSSILLKSGDLGGLAVREETFNALKKHFLVIPGEEVPITAQAGMERWGPANVPRWTDNFWHDFPEWTNEGRDLLSRADPKFAAWFNSMNPATNSQYEAALENFRSQVPPALSDEAVELEQFNADQFEAWQKRNENPLGRLSPAASAVWSQFLVAARHRDGYLQAELFLRLNIDRLSQQVLLARIGTRQEVIDDFATDPEEYRALVASRGDPMLMSEQDFVKFFVTGHWKGPHQGSLRGTFTQPRVDKNLSPFQGVLEQLLYNGVSRIAVLYAAVGIHTAGAGEELAVDIKFMPEKDCETFVWAVLEYFTRTHDNGGAVTDHRPLARQAA